MIRRLFLLLMLAALVAGAYLYVTRRGLGRATQDLGSLGRHLADAKTTASVEAAFELRRELAACDLDVSTEDGIVTLRGVVPQAALRTRALEIAGAVPGVRQVVDHIRLSDAARVDEGTGRSLGEGIDDQAVALRVRLALSLDRNLEQAPLEVSVFRREVTLTGAVEEARQAEAAVRLARETEGVTRVVDRIRIRRSETTPVERVRLALAAHVSLAPYRLAVQRRDGRLEVSGRVKTAAERDLAGLVAEKAAEGPVVNRIRASR